MATNPSQIYTRQEKQKRPKEEVNQLKMALEKGETLKIEEKASRHRLS
jgi:hypothetical protein